MKHYWLIPLFLVGSAYCAIHLPSDKRKRDWPTIVTDALVAVAFAFFAGLLWGAYL